MISYSYIYNKVWRPIVRLLRFRHRCGYGIHSPFAWAKVTGVVYECGLYYAYAPLLTAHPMGSGRHDGMTLGDLRLLFRLSNDTHPRRGHIVIQKGLAAPAAYLRSGCKSCQWTTADSAKPTLPAAEALDFVYLDAKTVDAESYYQEKCREIEATREWTTRQLAGLGFTVLPSKANFIFVKTDKMDGGELYKKLKEKGILVRHFTNPRICQFNRVTIGTKAQMQTLIDTVKEVLYENQ